MRLVCIKPNLDVLRRYALIANDSPKHVRFYALAIPDNEGAPRLLKKLGFPCDIRSDPAQRMMHITVHLTGAAPTEGLPTPKETRVSDER